MPTDDKISKRCIQCKRAFRTTERNRRQLHHCQPCRDRINRGRHPTDGGSGQHPKGSNYVPRFLRKREPRAKREAHEAVWFPGEEDAEV